MDWSPILLLVAPPIAGGIIGYFTNDLAIKMLFRPYKALYLGDRRLPFTPGLIPRNQERLARRVSETITGSLLDPDALQDIARRLLKVERVQGALQWLLELGLDRLQEDRQGKTVKIVASILHDLMGESLPRLLRVWARREDFLAAQLNHVFDRVLLDLKLSPSQARRLSQWVLDAILSPNTLRLAAIDFLTDANIQTIDESFRERSTGTYWVVANLFGLRNTLTRLRSFFLDEPATANRQLAELLVELRVRDRLEEWLLTLSLQNLPVSTVRQLRRTMRESVRAYAQERGAELLQGLSGSVDWERVAELLIGRLQASAVMRGSLDRVSYELALVLDRYLERDLESIVARAIPILELDRVIVDRIKSTSAEELELAAQAIVKNELQAIVNLGGILGFAIGCLQAGLLFFQR